MSTELCYFEKPFELQFTANVVSKKTLEDGRVCLVLDRTYFYPTGGGQEHDTGSVGQARVLDVFKDDQGNVIHVLDQDIEDEIVTARIDGERRFGHMQHHSAQHILTQCFQRVLDLETISVKISVDSPSAIDLYASDINPLDLTRVEELANSIIYQNRPIKSYFITEEDAHKVPFRRPPVITEQIRVIEVDGFDYSACGGTHCTATGMVGIIKVLKTDRRAEKLRVYFVAGKQALRCFQEYQDVVVGVVRHLNVGTDQIVDAVGRQIEQLRSLREELGALRIEMLPIEADKLAQTATEFPPYRLVLSSVKDRSAKELRALATLLQQKPGVIALLAGYGGGKLSLVAACADDTDVSAKELLNKHLSEVGGRGGGDRRIAQGGGSIEDNKIQTLLANVRDYIRQIERERQ